jgi:hypothetical protein
VGEAGAMSTETALLEQERAHLDKQIMMRLNEYTHWRSYNSRSKNLMFFANIACSLGATVSGLYKQAELAGLFGAILTAVLAIQKYFPVDKEATWYGVAVTRCKIMLNKANSRLATIDSLGHS